MMCDFKCSGTSIRTFTGKAFDLSAITPEMICIEDIAHGLSNTVRFAGQLPGFYSVAQHSWLAFAAAAPEHQMAALLHDASEAYMGDMPSPFKKCLPDFVAAENKLMSVIAEKYGFEWPLQAEIKIIDSQLLAEEWDSFVHGSGGLQYWTPEVAKKSFMDAFNSMVK